MANLASRFTLSFCVGVRQDLGKEQNGENRQGKCKHLDEVRFRPVTTSHIHIYDYTTPIFGLTLGPLRGKQHPFEPNRLVAPILTSPALPSHPAPSEPSRMKRKGFQEPETPQPWDENCADPEYPPYQPCLSSHAHSTRPSVFDVCSTSASCNTWRKSWELVKIRVGVCSREISSLFVADRFSSLT